MSQSAFPSSQVLHYFDLTPKAGCFPESETGVFDELLQREHVAVRLQLKVRGGRIIDTRFQALGPSCVIACAAYAAKQLVDQMANTLTALTGQQLIDVLQLRDTERFAAFFVEDLLMALAEKIEQEVTYER